MSGPFPLVITVLGTGIPEFGGWTLGDARTKSGHDDRVGFARYSFTALSRSALPITLTEERAMAAAATIGERTMPKAG